jgi:hypothetical protein
MDTCIREAVRGKTSYWDNRRDPMTFGHKEWNPSRERAKPSMLIRLFIAVTKY